MTYEEKLRALATVGWDSKIVGIDVVFSNDKWGAVDIPLNLEFIQDSEVLAFSILQMLEMRAVA